MENQTPTLPVNPAAEAASLQQPAEGENLNDRFKKSIIKMSNLSNISDSVKKISESVKEKTTQIKKLVEQIKEIQNDIKVNANDTKQTQAKINELNAQHAEKLNDLNNQIDAAVTAKKKAEEQIATAVTAKEEAEEKAQSKDALVAEYDALKNAISEAERNYNSEYSVLEQQLVDLAKEDEDLTMQLETLSQAVNALDEEVSPFEDAQDVREIERSTGSENENRPPVNTNQLSTGTSTPVDNTPKVNVSDNTRLAQKRREAADASGTSTSTQVQARVDADVDKDSSGKETETGEVEPDKDKGDALEDDAMKDVEAKKAQKNKANVPVPSRQSRRVKGLPAENTGLSSTGKPPKSTSGGSRKKRRHSKKSHRITRRKHHSKKKHGGRKSLRKHKKDHKKKRPIKRVTFKKHY